MQAVTYDLPFPANVKLVSTGDERTSSHRVTILTPSINGNGQPFTVEEWTWNAVGNSPEWTTMIVKRFNEDTSIALLCFGSGYETLVLIDRDPEEGIPDDWDEFPRVRVSVWVSRSSNNGDDDYRNQMSLCGKVFPGETFSQFLWETCEGNIENVANCTVYLHTETAEVCREQGTIHQANVRIVRTATSNRFVGDQMIKLTLEEAQALAETASPRKALALAETASPRKALALAEPAYPRKLDFNPREICILKRAHEGELTKKDLEKDVSTFTKTDRRNALTLAKRLDFLLDNKEVPESYFDKKKGRTAIPKVKGKGASPAAAPSKKVGEISSHDSVEELVQPGSESPQNAVHSAASLEQVDSDGDGELSSDNSASTSTGNSVESTCSSVAEEEVHPGRESSQNVVLSAASVEEVENDGEADLSSDDSTTSMSTDNSDSSKGSVTRQVDPAASAPPVLIPQNSSYDQSADVAARSTGGRSTGGQQFLAAPTVARGRTRAASIAGVAQAPAAETVPVAANAKGTPTDDPAQELLSESGNDKTKVSSVPPSFASADAEHQAQKFPAADEVTAVGSKKLQAAAGSAAESQRKNRGSAPEDMAEARGNKSVSTAASASVAESPPDVEMPSKSPASAADVAVSSTGGQQFLAASAPTVARGRTPAASIAGVAQAPAVESPASAPMAARRRRRRRRRERKRERERERDLGRGQAHAEEPAASVPPSFASAHPEHQAQKFPEADVVTAVGSKKSQTAAGSAAETASEDTAEAIGNKAVATAASASTSVAESPPDVEHKAQKFPADAVTAIGSKKLPAAAAAETPLRNQDSASEDNAEAMGHKAVPSVASVAKSLPDVKAHGKKRCKSCKGDSRSTSKKKDRDESSKKPASKRRKGNPKTTGEN